MKKTLLIAAIALVVTAGLVSLVNAQVKQEGRERINRSEFSTEMKAERENHQAEMQEIMENGTYDEWKEKVESRPRMTDYVTEENFAKFQEAHQLKLAGDIEGARGIMEELGIERGMGIGKRGFNRGMNKEIDSNCPCLK
jgi:hypothetical protein